MYAASGRAAKICLAPVCRRSCCSSDTLIHYTMYVLSRGKEAWNRICSAKNLARCGTGRELVLLHGGDWPFKSHVLHGSCTVLAGFSLQPATARKKNQERARLVLATARKGAVP